MRISEIQRPIEVLSKDLYKALFSPKVDHVSGSVCLYDAEVDDCVAVPRKSAIALKLTNSDFRLGRLFAEDDKEPLS